MQKKVSHGGRTEDCVFRNRSLVEAIFQFSIFLQMKFKPPFGSVGLERRKSDGALIKNERLRSKVSFPTIIYKAENSLQNGGGYVREISSKSKLLRFRPNHHHDKK